MGFEQPLLRRGPFRQRSSKGAFTDLSLMPQFLYHLIRLYFISDFNKKTIFGLEHSTTDNAVLARGLLEQFVLLNI